LHELRRLPGFPFPSLNDYPGVGNLRVAADVVEMEVRRHQVRDARRVESFGDESFRHGLTRSELDFEEFGEKSEPRFGIDAGVRVEPGIEEHQAAWMLDQIDRNRNANPSRGSGEEQVEIASEPAAREGV
jgi:hypothetical protein